ncbi:uncharacterized protein EDB91DRAFT_1169829 [Suillus paluster]|uniref:uncharacterized protein n=1 Tax=Suillus paluster TaxID=48578 RepID=UPI001B8756F1|nr:uncharacterized protein EDB91DRAFT_1169829 [Suillus paluster]KAG1724904.1 hypothetical protein EDB91DRAFT_1169829 [Suillus paluster]
MTFLSHAKYLLLLLTHLFPDLAFAIRKSSRVILTLLSRPTVLDPRARRIYSFTLIVPSYRSRAFKSFLPFLVSAI